MAPPLNQELQHRLASWLNQSEFDILKSLLRAKVVLAQAGALEMLGKAVNDEQYLKDALAAAREADFYERVLTLLVTVQLGHNPGKPDETFEYVVVQAITDQEPLTTQSNA